MGFLSDKPEKRFLNAGDHIYVYRFLSIYSHHGIYMGDDKVAHFTSTRKAKKAKGSCSVCKNMEFSERESGVIESCLECFLNKGTLHRYRYGVGKVVFGLLYAARLQGGTSNYAESDPAEVVLERASTMLQTNGFGDYNLFRNNCEDFASYCKTGHRCSKNRNGQSPIVLAMFGSRNCN